MTADLGYIQRRIDDAKQVVVDCETTGLDWRRDRTVGFVITFSGDPRDSHYLPVRHGGGGNMDPDVVIPMLRSSLRRQSLRTVGFNYAFDLKYLANDGIAPEGPLEDGQINSYLLDENQRSFSLDGCCRYLGVQEKKGDELYAYLASRFGGDADRTQMKNFHLLAGDDPIGVDYAVGDGTSTWQLVEKQQRMLDDENLRRVWDIECRCIRVLHRMTSRGVKIDHERFEQVYAIVKRRLEEARNRLPSGFNERAPSQLRPLFENAGHANWPTTAKGNPSFSEGWLTTFPLGRDVVAVRKLGNLISSFLDPLRGRHIWNGRVHCTYNQTRNESHGTVTGRLSCSDPNLQQVHKRDEILGSLFRSLFIPDYGMIWGSPDYSQCFAAGTAVSVPGGTKNIEDVRVGDLVYSYDNSRRLVLRRVTWSGQTGTRPVCRVAWATNGRTRGYLDVTPDHRIRLLDGSYRTVTELAEAESRGFRSRFPYSIRVMALRRHVARIGKKEDKYFRHMLHVSGIERSVPEARFVFEQVNGWSPEVVHHEDENSLNDDPGNLVGVTWAEHNKIHGAYGVRGLSPSQRKDRSLVATRALQAKFRLVGNHFITHIVPLAGEVPVYDITVEDTHNFIANEICVHNCEPRLLAHYGKVQVLLDGYRADPPVDAHSAVALAANISRQAGKTLNQALITGSGDRHAAEMLGLPMEEAMKIVNSYFQKMPEIKHRFVTDDGLVVRGGIQAHAANVMRARGYVRSLLGRKARLDDMRFAYKALNRLLQTGNADVLKKAMVEVDEYLVSEGDQVNLLNNIHDSLDYQYPPELERQYREALRIMEDYGPGRSVDLSIPLVVEEDSGANWAEASYGADKVRKAFSSMGADYDGLRAAA